MCRKLHALSCVPDHIILKKHCVLMKSFIIYNSVIVGGSTIKLIIFTKELWTSFEGSLAKD